MRLKVTTVLILSGIFLYGCNGSGGDGKQPKPADNPQITIKGNHSTLLSPAEKNTFTLTNDDDSPDTLSIQLVSEKQALKAATPFPVQLHNG